MSSLKLSTNPPPSLSKGAGECSAAPEKENAIGWNVKKRFEKPPEGSDDVKKRLFALSEGSDDEKKRLYTLSEGSDDEKKRLFALSEGSDDMKKRLFTRPNHSQGKK